MPELLFGIFLLVAVIAIAAVLFAGWVCAAVLRALWRLVTLPARTARVRRPPPTKMPPCGRAGCTAENPVDARFCRRCGRPLHRAESVQIRRAAMW